MNDKFEQKRLFRSKSIKILKSGVEIKYKSLFSYKEYSIDFEQLSTKKSIIKESNSGILFFVFGFGLATIVIFLNVLADGDKGLGSTFFFLFLTLLFLSIALLTRKKVIVLHTNYGADNLEISFNRTNEALVREFADLIINKTKEFLLNKYSKIDKDLPKENQLENLSFLRDKDLIDEAEYIRLKNILFDKDSERKIGYN